jgi:hypothetical protein
MGRRDFAGRFLEMSKREDAEVDSYILEGYKAPLEIGMHQTMADNRKEYDWQKIVSEATEYFKDASQPLEDRVEELMSLVRVRPESSDVPEDFSALHQQVVDLLVQKGKEAEAMDLAQGKFIPLGIELLRKKEQ